MSVHQLSSVSTIFENTCVVHTHKYVCMYVCNVCMYVLCVYVCMHVRGL